MAVLNVVKFVLVGAVAVIPRVVVLASVGFVDAEVELVIFLVVPVVVCLKNVRGAVVVVSVVVAGVFVSASIRTVVSAVNVVVLIVVEFVVDGATTVFRRVVVASIAFVDVEAELVIVSVIPVVACVDGVSGAAVIV